jgi:transposase
MEHDLLFPRPAMLRMEWMAVLPGGVVFGLSCRKSSACCPCCETTSSRVHSRYVRTVDDLPMHGRRVRLRLTVRRFFCDNEGCARRTFAERFDGVAETYARKTSRLVEALCEIGFACGGEGGSRLADALGMVVSGDTLLNLIRRCPLPAAPELRVLGVDDWAWRRGRRYGTILCDLVSHRPVALLAERSAESLSAWLKDRPGVQAISRDRAGCYAEGCAKGAPQAVQVADRFHLLVNAREALVRVLERYHGDIAAAAGPAAQTPAQPAAEEPEVSVPPPSVSEGPPTAHTASRERRLARYQQVMGLHAQGISLREIGRRLHLHRSTVRRFVQAGQFPERATRRYSRKTDRFEAYLRRRWAEGCHNAGQLHQEVLRRGFEGSYAAVRRCVAPWRTSEERRHTPGTKPAPERKRPVARPSAKRVAWLLLREPADRRAEDQRLVEALCKRCPAIRRATNLVRAFAFIVRERRAADLDGWIARTKETGTPREVRAFARGLLKDEPAVRAALSLPWSNGQVEGQVNRLKLIKRMMYGRGGFELLRRRVLYRSQPAGQKSATVTFPSIRGNHLAVAAA